MTKLVSILMTVYNSELFLKNAIQSIINQTYNNWELIIINDFSYDNSLNIINQYKNNNKIKIINNNMNYGTYFSLNEGLKIIKGYYITKIDSDDVYDINKIKNQVEFMEKNNIEACTCNILRGQKINNKIIYYQEAKDSSLMFTYNVFKNIGYFDNVRFDSDSEYFYRLKKYFTIMNLDENLYYARTVTTSLTNSFKTGTGINQFGAIIRNNYKNLYKSSDYKYINHPKFIKNYDVHPFQKCPIDIEISGNYKILNESENFVEIEFLDNNKIITNYYKIIPNKNINIFNQYNTDFKIYDLENNIIHYNDSEIENKTFYFFSYCEYIKIIYKFQDKIIKFYPLLVSI